jgi:hypothetical protein
MCGLLEGVAKREQPSFGKLAAEELDAYRQAFRSESGGHGKGGKRDERGETAVVAQVADTAGIRDRQWLGRN